MVEEVVEPLEGSDLDFLESFSFLVTVGEAISESEEESESEESESDEEDESESDEDEESEEEDEDEEVDCLRLIGYL